MEPGIFSNAFYAASLTRVLAESEAKEDPKGHYKALQLTRDASIAEVHKAYRRRALETHPEPRRKAKPGP